MAVVLPRLDIALKDVLNVEAYTRRTHVHAETVRVCLWSPRSSGGMGTRLTSWTNEVLLARAKRARWRLVDNSSSSRCPGR